MSALVPPMSRLIALSKPHWRAKKAPGHRPCRRAGNGDAGGVAGDRLGGHDPAAGVEDEHVALVLAIAQAIGEVRQVAADDRRQAGVDDRRAEALVLEDLGQDLVGGADEDAGRLLLHDRFHARLVLAVHVGVDEGDRDRFVAALLDPPRHRTSGFLVEFGAAPLPA